MLVIENPQVPGQQRERAIRMRPGENLTRLTQGILSPKWLLPDMHNALRFIRRVCNVHEFQAGSELLAAQPQPVW